MVAKSDGSIGKTSHPTTVAVIRIVCVCVWGGGGGGGHVVAFKACILHSALYSSHWRQLYVVTRVTVNTFRQLHAMHTHYKPDGVMSCEPIGGRQPVRGLGREEGRAFNVSNNVGLVTGRSNGGSEGVGWYFILEGKAWVCSAAGGQFMLLLCTGLSSSHTVG